MRERQYDISVIVLCCYDRDKYKSNYSSFLTLLLCWCWVRMMMGAVAGASIRRNIPFDPVDDSMQ